VIRFGQNQNLASRSRSHAAMCRRSCHKWITYISLFAWQHLHQRLYFRNSGN